MFSSSRKSPDTNLSQCGPSLSCQGFSSWVLHSPTVYSTVNPLHYVKLWIQICVFSHLPHPPWTAGYCSSPHPRLCGLHSTLAHLVRLGHLTSLEVAKTGWPLASTLAFICGQDSLPCICPSLCSGFTKPETWDHPCLELSCTGH